MINTGKTLLPILEPDMLVVCNVINRSAVPLFERQLMTVRISDNSFIGKNVAKQVGTTGPDTTMRLFNQI